MRLLEEEHDHLVEKVKAALMTTAEVVERMDKRTSGVIEAADNILKAANDVIAAGKEQTGRIGELRETYENILENLKRLREELEKDGISE